MLIQRFALSSDDVAKISLNTFIINMSVFYPIQHSWNILLNLWMRTWRHGEINWRNTIPTDLYEVLFVCSITLLFSCVAK